MHDEVSRQAVHPDFAETEFEIWRSLDRCRVLIRAGDGYLDLSSAAAIRLARELLQADGK